MFEVRISSKVMAAILLVAVAASFILLFGKYRPAEIDDAWTASYVWNITHKNITDDIVFGAVSNVKYFGHIHAVIAGFVADMLGWQKASFHLLNLLCVFGAALAWFFSSAKLLGNKMQALVFVLLLFALEPFIGAAYKARSDAMALCFISFGMMAAVYGRFFLATLLVSLAVEIHAISCIGYFWIAAILLSNLAQAEFKLKPIRMQLLGSVLGGVLGFALYRAMHPQALADILNYLAASNTSFADSFNALTAHYFQREYYRFIPELLFWVVGAFLFFWQRKQIFNAQNVIMNLFWVTIVASLLMQRGNFHYVIFFYPPLFLIAFTGYWSSVLRYPALIALFFYATALSGTLYYQNRFVDHKQFDLDLAAVLPAADRPVVGLPNAWFVLREKDFYENYQAMLSHQGKRPDFIYYIKSRYSKPLPACASELATVGDFNFNREKIEVKSVDLQHCPDN